MALSDFREKRWLETLIQRLDYPDKLGHLDATFGVTQRLYGFSLIGQRANHHHHYSGHT